MFDSNGVLNNNHFDLTENHQLMLNHFNHQLIDTKILILTENHQLIDTGLVFLMQKMSHHRSVRNL